MNELILSKEIYNYYHIFSATEQFRNLCKISIEETSAYYICSFSDCIYDMDETMHEFENYVIDLMNTGNIND